MARHGTPPKGWHIPDVPAGVEDRASSDAPRTTLVEQVRARLPVWQGIHASPVVRRWIREGVPITFAGRRPRPFRAKPYEMDEGQQQWFRQEFERLRTLGAWREATDTRWVSPAFLVPKPPKEDGTLDWRLVVDLRRINRHCLKRSCRYETLRYLESAMRRGEYLFSWDIKDGFYHIEIRPEDQAYMTFSVKLGDEIRYVTCVGLPMGWVNSPYVFTKFMRPVVQHLRAPGVAAEMAAQRASGASRRFLYKTLDPNRRGLRVLPYVDDFLGIARTEERAREALRFVDTLLGRLGIFRHPTKGVFEPQQRLDHLGLRIDAQRGVFEVTGKRARKIAATAAHLLSKAKKERRWVEVKSLASLVGLCNSCLLAVPPAQFFLRSLYDAIERRSSWAGRVKLDRQNIRDIQWWADFTTGNRWNGRPIWRLATTAVLHTDAAGGRGQGWGAKLNGKEEARGYWRAHQLRHHITVLELKAVRFALETFRQQLRGRVIRLHEDNMGVVGILRKSASRDPVLMKEMRKVWWILAELDARIDVEYIRSADNVDADRLSRLQDRDDWRLNPRLFQRFDEQYHQHTVDRFATANNALCRRYNSQWHDPGTEAVDALAQDWSQDTNWINPPWHLLSRVVTKLQQTPGVRATVVAPCWASAPWFPQLMALSDCVEILPPGYDVFLPGTRGSRAPVGNAGWSVAVCRITPGGGTASIA